MIWDALRHTCTGIVFLGLLQNFSNVCPDDYSLVLITSCEPVSRRLPGDRHDGRLVTSGLEDFLRLGRGLEAPDEDGAVGGAHADVLGVGAEGGTAPVASNLKR